MIGPHQLEAVPALRLLTTLDALVRRDAGPSGLQGTVALGVRTADRDYFWICKSAGGPTETWFAESPPEGADAVLLLGVPEADSILEDRALPEPPQLELRGDPAPIVRLCARYLRTRSLLGLRTKGAPD